MTLEMYLYTLFASHLPHGEMFKVQHECQLGCPLTGSLDFLIYGQSKSLAQPCREIQEFFMRDTQKES